MIRSTCETCYFFTSFSNTDFPVSGYRMGQCRLGPPVLGTKADGNPRTLWPMVRGTDFCGEHAVQEQGDG